MYQHQWFIPAQAQQSNFALNVPPKNSPIASDSPKLPAGKIVCVGRNYAEHALELNNPIPSEPVLFIKPATALCALTPSFSIPKSDCHYEAELAFLIGEPLTNATPDEAEGAIVGVGLALDLTKRELQSQLKQKSLPWELAKSFDGACPISPFVSMQDIGSPVNQLEYKLYIDGELRQHGRSQDMLTPSVALIAHISSHFTLMPGDIVLTGTPKGVGELHCGQTLKLELDQCFSVDTEVI